MKFFLIAMLLMACPIAAFAQTQWEMNDQACEKAKAADKELNRVYQQVLREYADKKQFIANFKKAQRAWLAFRDAEYNAEYPGEPDYQWGSVRPMCDCFWMEGFTKNRVDGLRVWLKGIEEGEVCSDSYKRIPTPENKP